MVQSRQVGISFRTTELNIFPNGFLLSAHPELDEGHERLVYCHSEFVVVERRIRGRVVNKVFLPVAVDTFVLSLPTPRILQSPLVTSE
jgi:hypothetical protein